MKYYGAPSKTEYPNSTTGDLFYHPHVIIIKELDTVQIHDLWEFQPSAQPAACTMCTQGRIHINTAVYAKYTIYPAGVDFDDLSMPRALRISIY